MVKIKDHKKFLEFEITRHAWTTVCVSYDDRERSWEKDREELTEFAVSIARKNGRNSNYLHDDDYDATTKGPSNSDQGIESDEIPPRDDWMWRRFVFATSEFPEVSEGLVCTDGCIVYRQMMVDGMKMRSVTSLDLRQAKNIASAQAVGIADGKPQEDDDAYVFECFRMLMRTNMDNEAIMVMFGKVFS